MRSPAFLVISLVSTTLLSGSSASSSSVATPGKPQVGSVLGRSREMIQMVNATLRKVQAGVSEVDYAALNAEVDDRTRIFNNLTAQMLAATAQIAQQPVQVQAQAQVNTTTTTTVAPTESHSTASPQNSASSQETPMSSVGPVANAKLVSTTSPRLTIYEDEGDEDIALPNNITGKKQSREGRIEEVESQSRKALRQENAVADSSSSTTRATAGPTVAKIENNKLFIGIDANTIKKRLDERKAKAGGVSSSSGTIGSVTTSTSNVNTTSSSSSNAASSTVSSTTVSAKVTASPVNTAQIGTTAKVVPSPIQAAPLQVASVTPTNSPTDELAALISDTGAFLKRFFELDQENPEIFNRPTGRNGQTLFELAFRSGNMDITDFLLGTGYFTVTFANGESVLVEALKKKNSELVRRFMDNARFHNQVTYFALGLARYDSALFSFLMSFVESQKK